MKFELSRQPLLAVCAMLLVAPTVALSAPASAFIVDDEHNKPNRFQADGEQPKADETAAEVEDADKADEGLGLETTRNVSFETNEGTWISLDVSPDGEQIVFELLGDIYTMPMAGGEAKAILTGNAFESQPVYSPDGTQIAFVSDRDGSDNLWVAGIDGSEPKKISGDSASIFQSPEWSPEGDYIYVARNLPASGGNQITMYHVDGGSGIDLTTPGGPDAPRDRKLNATAPMPTPDGKYIYYSTRFRNFSYNVSEPLWSIQRRDFDTGAVDEVITALGSAFRPVISPDGQNIVYGTRFDQHTGLRIRNLETGADRWLAYPVTRDEQESVATRDILPGYSFTPDGQDIILSVDGGIKRLNVASGEMTDIPFTAGVSQDLGPLLHFSLDSDEGDVKARILQHMAQSPRGDQVVFGAFAKIYAAGLDGSAPRRLTKSGDYEFEPHYTPDGEWVVYVTFDSAEGGHIWKTRANGRGEPQRLTTYAAYYSDLAVTPDGKTVVAMRAPNREHMQAGFDSGPFLTGLDVVKLPITGGAPELVRPNRVAFSLHFREDSNRVYFTTMAGLTSMRLDGTDEKQHLQVSGPTSAFNARPQTADEIKISPNGKWALAYVKNQLYISAVPRTGGGAEDINIGGGSVPIKRLTDIGADYFAWADGGDTITWAVGARFHRMALADVSFKQEDDDATEEDVAEEADAPKTEDAAEEAAEAEEEDADKPIEALEDTTEGVEHFDISVTVPRDVPSGSVLLADARVITMNGEQVFERGDILVSGSKIVAVGERGSLDIPRGTKRIDMSGKTIVPGFVDSHAHWFDIRRGVLDVGHWGYRANLAYGVTAGLDVQTGTNDQFIYQDLIEAGIMSGPRGYSTGPGIFPTNAFASKDEVYNLMKRYRDHYRTRNLKAYLSGNRKQRQWVVESANELGMMPTTEGGLDLKLDLTHVLDGMTGNEHSLPVVPLYKDVVELHAQSGTGYTPTLLVAYGGPWAENYFYERENAHDNEKLAYWTPHTDLDAKTLRRGAGWFDEREYHFKDVAKSAADILRAGGYVGVGSHGQLQGLGYHWELWAIASGGLSPMEALYVATLSSATIIGREDEIGSIEAGKFADLVILNSNPMDDIRNTDDIHQVMKNGRIYNGDTLDQVYPDNVPAAPRWWTKLMPN